MDHHNQLRELVMQRRTKFERFSDRIFDTPEIAYAETASASEHARMLREEGFRTKTNLAGIPTSVMGSAGSGSPMIAFLGEFDALPGLGQVAGLAEPRPVVEGGAGHGCGHNLLGSGSLLAAAALREYMAVNSVPGTVRYYGCPAEEGGSAKTFMARAGVFDDIDVAISWHPGPTTEVKEARTLAYRLVDYAFRGRAAHASSSPELGRSALDAVELMSVGVNYLREHIPDTARVHYAYLDAGGIAPSVVQASASVRYIIRARDVAEVEGLCQRVDRIATGAAMMTETTMSTQVISGVSNLLGNRPLEEAMQANLDRLGPVPFDADDWAFAEEIRATLSHKNIEKTFLNIGRDPDMELPLCDFVVPLDRPLEGGMGSSDVGDVSWIVPTVQARIATCAIGTPLHSWQQTAQGKSVVAHKGMVHAALLMAATGCNVLESPQLLAAAKATHANAVGMVPYCCPIPASVAPPV